jgi:hypothetical protein
MAVTPHPRHQQPSRRLFVGFGWMMGLYAVSSVVGGVGQTSDVLSGIGMTLSLVSILGAGLVLSWFVVVKWRRQPAQVLARARSRPHEY